VRILGFADFHGNVNSARRASAHISRENPSLVVVAGDLANRSAPLAEHILRELSQSVSKVFFVPGNMDEPILANWKEAEHIICLHGKRVLHNSVMFLGLGGAVRSPFKTPFEFDEAEAGKVLSLALQDSPCNSTVLISHCPPKDTKLDLTAKGSHVGSKSVRTFIEQRRPALVVCGHVHEAQGVDYVETVPIVNTGPAAHGNYASISLNDSVDIEFHKF